MDHILMCLHKAVTHQDQFSQSQICSEIVDFIQSAQPESRNYLITQLCRPELITLLNEGLTSSTTSLLTILKLLCYISENPNFNIYFWMLLKSIARALVFLVNSNEIVQLQVEFTEVIFMVEILMRRFQKQTHHLDESNLQILKTFQSIITTVMKNHHLSYLCKLCVFSLLSQIFWIAHRLEVHSTKKYRMFFHSLMETFCLSTENVLPELATTNKMLMIFVSAKWLSDLLKTAKNYVGFDCYCFGKLILNNFKKHYWEYLFEDTTDIVLANFLITFCNWFIWKMKLCDLRISHSISEISAQYYGIERLIIFLNDKNCDIVLKQKTKLLINALALATKQNPSSNPTEKRKLILPYTFFAEEIELFTDLAQIENNRLYISARSFIFIFYNLLKNSDWNGNEYISIIFLKMCSIIKRKHANHERLIADEFWLALSIYLICQEITRKQNERRGPKMKLFSKTNEMFKCLFEEDFCIAPSLTELEQFEWLKINDSNLFERSVVNCISQRIFDTDDSLFEALTKLTTPNQILYLLLSKNYYQVVNSGKILLSKQLNEEDLNSLLHLYILAEEMDAHQFFGLLYLTKNSMDKCVNKKDVLKIYMNVLRSVRLRSSKFNDEITSLLFEAIFRAIKCYDGIQVVIYNDK